VATIEAKITKIEQELGSEWFRISTDHSEIGRLDTKDPVRAREAVAAQQSGAVVVIDYTRRPSTKVNPHSGAPYPDNFYFNSVKTPEPGRPSGPIEGVDVVQQTQRPTDPATAWRISLAAGAKLAVGMLPLMPSEQQNFMTAQQMALVWGRWLFTTPLPSGPSEPTGSAQDDPRPLFDEDFPF
jgi:hypothetical protein